MSNEFDERCTMNALGTCACSLQCRGEEAALSRPWKEGMGEEACVFCQRRRVFRKRVLTATYETKIPVTDNLANSILDERSAVAMDAVTTDLEPNKADSSEREASIWFA